MDSCHACIEDYLAQDDRIAYRHRYAIEHMVYRMKDWASHRHSAHDRLTRKFLSAIARVAIVCFWPVGFDYASMFGRYGCTLPDSIARGWLKPMRDP